MRSEIACCETNKLKTCASSVQFVKPQEAEGKSHQNERRRICPTHKRARGSTRRVRLRLGLVSFALDSRFFHLWNVGWFGIDAFPGDVFVVNTHRLINFLLQFRVVVDPDPVSTPNVKTTLRNLQSDELRVVHL